MKGRKADARGTVPIRAAQSDTLEFLLDLSTQNKTFNSDSYVLKPCFIVIYLSSRLGHQLNWPSLPLYYERSTRNTPSGLFSTCRLKHIMYTLTFLLRTARSHL